MNFVTTFGEIKDLNFNNDGMHQSQRIGNLRTRFNLPLSKGHRKRTT